MMSNRPSGAIGADGPEARRPGHRTVVTGPPWGLSPRGDTRRQWSGRFRRTHGTRATTLPLGRAPPSGSVRTSRPAAGCLISSVRPPGPVTARTTTRRAAPLPGSAASRAAPAAEAGAAVKEQPVERGGAEHRAGSSVRRIDGDPREINRTMVNRLLAEPARAHRRGQPRAPGPGGRSDGAAADPDARRSRWSATRAPTTSSPPTPTGTGSPTSAPTRRGPARDRPDPPGAGGRRRRRRGRRSRDDLPEGDDRAVGAPGVPDRAEAPADQVRTHMGSIAVFRLESPTTRAATGMT